MGNRTIDPFAPRQIGHPAPFVIARHQCHRIIDPRNRARGQHGFANEHIGRSDRVEQAAVLVLLGRGNRDVEVPAGYFKGLLEGQVGDDFLQPFLDLKLAHPHGWPERVEDCLAFLILIFPDQHSRIEERRQFVIGAGADQRADHRAAARTGNDRWQQPLGPQRLNHARMEEQERARTAHQQGGAAIAMLGAAEEIALFLKRDVIHFCARQMVQRLGHGIHVIVDQLFGAKPRFAPQMVVGHPIHIAVDAFVERVEQPLAVSGGAQFDQPLQSAADRTVIKMLADIGFAPARLARPAIQIARRVGPLVIGGRLGEGGL